IIKLELADLDSLYNEGAVVNFDWVDCPTNDGLSPIKASPNQYPHFVHWITPSGHFIWGLICGNQFWGK
ncbi:unnamed protein product, partial [Rotaria socialis]